MARNVIHIFGASGSGTSTLGRYIAEQTGFFFMDTDDYFWLPTNPPYTTKRSAAERLSLMKKDILSHESVVISGSLTDWGDELIPLFTLVIRLNTETSVRIERLKARERGHFGNRLDEGGDMHRNHLAFLKWAAAYDEGGPDMRSKCSHDIWQKLLPCPVLLLNGNAPLDENYACIRAHISNE